MTNTTSRESLQAFSLLMHSTGEAGLIDERNKELINFSLVVLSKCGPCIEVHWEKARKMGISEEELDEAAWCAIAMGGAPVRMFYMQFKKSIVQ